MTDEKMTQGEQIELLPFDPIVVVLDVLRRWYLVLAAALLVYMAAYVLVETTYEPQYTTSTTFVVSMQESTATVYQNLSATTSLATVFSEVLNSSLLRAIVNETLAPAQFDGVITATAVAETNLITMRVTADDPRTAFLATRAVIEHHHELSSRIVGDIVLEVLQQPAVPTAPSNPLDASGSAKKAALLAAAAACLLLGAYFALRDSVRSAEEARRKLDCRVLAELRHERKLHTLRALLHRRKTSILIRSPLISFGYRETIRNLRRRVEQHMPEGGKVILVTSALENEGKSTVAVNLALSLAQKHRRVLLLDGDLRKPACAKILDLAWQGHGVADVVRGEAEAAKSTRPYAEGSTLDLLLESRASHASGELAAGDGMAALIRWAREQYDVVVLDTPPMSAGSDAECLADLADASILIVRQGEAEVRLLSGALEVLYAARSELLGVVLNNCYASPLSGQGGYGYGKYGRYGGYGKYGRYGAYGAQNGK